MMQMNDATTANPNNHIEVTQLLVNRYRTEQNVSIKLNRIPITHTESKIDYTITQNKHKSPFCYRIQVDDHISKISPDAHQEVLNIVSDIEAIKCNVELLIDPLTGKIDHIENHTDIYLAWQQYKKSFIERFEFVRADETKKNIAAFVTAYDEQIKNIPQLISGLENQLFFNTFFDNYLIGNTNFETVGLLNFRSQLFENIITPMQLTKRIVKESPDIVVVRKTGLPTGMIDNAEIERQYNEKYQPVIDYHFSKYEAEYDAQLAINTQQNCLEYAEIRMNEFVKNNVELAIVCQIRRIS